MDTNPRTPPAYVYEAYEAVEACARLYARAAAVVQPITDFHYEATPEGLAEVAEQLLPIMDELKTETDRARELIEPLRRDMHQASDEVIDWVRVKGASIAEAVVAAAEYQVQHAWDADSLADPELVGARHQFDHGPTDADFIVAHLQKEAAAVLQVLRSKGPDLSRLTPTEQRIWAAVLTHGPISRQEIARLAHASDSGGGLKTTVNAMHRFGLLDKNEQGMFTVPNK
jgi:hypothetical protein